MQVILTAFFVVGPCRIFEYADLKRCESISYRKTNNMWVIITNILVKNKTLNVASGQQVLVNFIMYPLILFINITVCL